MDIHMCKKTSVVKFPKWHVYLIHSQLPILVVYMLQKKKECY